MSALFAWKSDKAASTDTCHDPICAEAHREHMQWCLRPTLGMFSQSQCMVLNHISLRRGSGQLQGCTVHDIKGAGDSKRPKRTRRVRCWTSGQRLGCARLDAAHHQYRRLMMSNSLCGRKLLPHTHVSCELLACSVGPLQDHACQQALGDGLTKGPPMLNDRRFCESFPEEQLMQCCLAMFGCTEMGIEWHPPH